MFSSMKYLIVILSGIIGLWWLPAIDTSVVNVIALQTNWTLVNSNGSITRKNVKVPSGVYSILYGEHVLEGYNDVNMRWIANDSWTYTQEFAVAHEYLEMRHLVNLTFHGIDTIAEIRLNHALLGRPDNMFVRYSYDVTKLLQVDNLLEVEIKSPIKAAAEKAAALQQQNITVPPNCPPERYNGECHMNMLRKMQASFAWDWGLAAPSLGIWKPVSLESYEVALIRDVDVIITKNSTHWNMHINVFMDAGGNKDFYCDLKFIAVELLNDPVLIKDYREQRISYKAPMITFDQAIPIEKVQLWWPNGYGSHKLYPLHFTLNAWVTSRGPDLRAASISRKAMHVGFRTIELVEEPAPDGQGNTFLFKVNGVEMFMKGVNYIPSHILPEMSTNQTRIKHLLHSVQEANMNMIRVWGGGLYESDYFYDTADSLGILIWHDMMFACAMYPATPEFLASVRSEVVQNARRIAYHASIAIFATNNENEVALTSNWYNTEEQRAHFEADYRELYVANVLHELKVVQSSARPGPLVSSPSNGKRSEEDNYISTNPQDPHYGDVHFYDITRDAWEAHIYPRPRFASEYGFQSLPKLQSWLRTKDPQDENLYALVRHRQHHPFAMLPITILISWHFHLPLPEDDDYLEVLIYYSQLSQAMATKTETELYRSQRDTEKRTMGALYWQLNDVWVAPSWSSIDFYGNYKVLHYWAKEFMAPIAIIALHDMPADTINVTLACDLQTVETANLSVTMNVYNWSSLYAKRTSTWPVTLKPNGMHYDKVIPSREIFQNGSDKFNSFVQFTLQRGSDVLSSTYYFPSAFQFTKGVVDPELELKISSSHCAKANEKFINSYSLTVFVKYPAIFVYIEIMHENIWHYKLSRNGYMQLQQVQTVHLEFEHDQCVNIVRDQIKVLTVNQFVQ